MERANEVVEPPGRHLEQVRVRRVVAGVHRIVARRLDVARGAPHERVVRLRHTVIHPPLACVHAVDGKDAAVLPHVERGRIVIVLLEMWMEHDRLRRAALDVVHRHLDVPRTRIADVRLVPPDGADRSHDQFAFVHDDARIHEPRPAAVVVQLHERRGDVVVRITVLRPHRDSGGEDEQQDARTFHGRLMVRL